MCLFQNEFKIIPWNKSNLFIFVHKICFAFFFLFEVVKQKFNRPNIRIKKLEWICMALCVNVSFVIVEKIALIAKNILIKITDVLKSK